MIDFKLAIKRVIVISFFLDLIYLSISSLIINYFYDMPTFAAPGTWWTYIKSLIITGLDIDTGLRLSKGLHDFFLIRGQNYDLVKAESFKDYILNLKCGLLFKYLVPFTIIVSPITSIAIVSQLFLPLKKGQSGDFVRGSKKVDSNKLVKLLNKDCKSIQQPLTAEPIHIPLDLETRHFLTVGSTGSGKSAMLCQFINSMTVRRSKMVLYDRKGELVSKFYSNSDIIFNPYDQRFSGWNVFNEFDLYSGLDSVPEELTNIANSLFTTAADNKNRHFYDGAASIFKSGCCYLKIKGLTTNKDLYTFFTSDPASILKAINSLPPALSEGKAFLMGGGDVSASFVSCLVNRVKAFQPFIGRDGDFKVRDWISNDSDKRKLFLSTAGANDSLYLPVLTVILDIIGHGLRAKSESKQRRIFFILDELSSLPPLKTLQMLLREGRSRGACCFLTTQTMASVESQYGRSSTADIMGLCNSLFIFRTSEPGQSDYFSKALGDAEFIKTNNSRGTSSRGVLDSNFNKSKSETHVIQRLFLSGELQELPTGTAVVKIGSYPISKINFKFIDFKARVPGFIEIKRKFATAEELNSAIKPPVDSDSDSDEPVMF